MRDATILPILLATVVATVGMARADWHAPIAGATTILPTHFEAGDAPLTVHVAPHADRGGEDGAGSFPRWTQPLVDRHLDTSTRFAPLDAGLLETIARVEPIYDPTLLEGPNVIVPMHVSAGTAEMRDLFGDHWRLASADTNVDADVRPLAMAWTAGAAPRPCAGYRIRRHHAWGEAALSAPTAADCHAIRARQRLGFADTSPIPVAVAAPPIPVFAAPEPGSRMSSTDFWAAQRARIASIHDHLNRKWIRRSPIAVKSAKN